MPMRPGFGVHPGFGPGFNSGFRPGFNPAFRHGFVHNGFGRFNGSSVVISPFFGFPFDPFYFSGASVVPLYVTPTYVAPDAAVAAEQLVPSNGDQTSNNLNAPSVTLILKDGRRINAEGYAIVGSTLWILDSQNAMKISISDVDVDATRNENLKQGINVVFPASP
jgi:hypothetical protein